MTSAPGIGASPTACLSLRGRPPVLSRGPGQVQVGVDSEPSLVLVGVHAQLRQVLGLLDGRHPLSEVRAQAGRLGVSQAHLDWAMRRLAEAGLIENDRRAADAGHGPTAQVRLVGAGRLGHGVATLLATSPVSDLYVVDDQPPDLALYPSSGAVGSQAEALAAGWDPATQVTLHVLNHWSKPESRPPDLTIVATDRIECDRVVAGGLLRADQPHLFLRAGGGGVVVGPFVVPGQTACLHCTDLARRDADPAWPTLLPQLTRARAPLSSAQVGWAAGVAVAQVLAFLSGAAPETYGATLELSSADYLTRRRSWAMHAACGCGWSSPAEWAT